MSHIHQHASPQGSNAEEGLAPTPAASAAPEQHDTLDAGVGSKVDRSALLRILGPLASAGATFSKRASTAQFAQAIRSAMGRGSAPREAGHEDCECECHDSPPSSFMGLIKRLGHICHSSIAASQQLVDSLIALLHGALEEEPDEGASAPTGPLAPSMPFASSPQPSKPNAIVEGLLALSPPTDAAQDDLAAALAQVAVEHRREREEARHEAVEREEERHRKIVSGRDAIRAADLEDGESQEAAEMLIDEIEGPYAISVEAAVARMRQLNKAKQQ